LTAEQPKHAGIRRHVALGAASNYAGQIINLCVWFVLTPIIVRHLGAQYSLWVLVANFVAYGSLADLGIGTAVVKYVAEHRARGENELASQLIATALRMYAVLGLLVVVVALIIAQLVPQLLKVPAAERGTTSWLIVISAIGVALQLPAATASGVLRGLGRFDLMNLIGSLAMLSLAASTLVVLALGGKVIAITALTIPITVFWLIPAVWLIHRTAPELRFSLRGGRRSMARRVITFSSALVGIGVAQTVKLQSDELVIAAVLGVGPVGGNVGPVGRYGIARRLSGLTGQLTYQFVSVLLPLASRLHAEEAPWLVREVFLSGLRLTVALFAVIGGALIVFAAPFLSTWVGPQFASNANIVVLLTLAAFAEALMWPANATLLGVNRHRPLVVFAVGSAALNLGLSIALVGPLGVRGVALGTVIASSIQAAIVLAFSARALGVRRGEVCRQVLVPGLVPLIPMAAVLIAIHSLLRPHTIPAIGAAGVAGAVTYGIAYLGLPGAANERATVVRLALLGRRVLTRSRGAGVSP
jgi:O-antigen/teichoic acid export membrane protein